MNFHSLKIQKIVSETLDAKTIYFELPDDIVQEFMHHPGQYLTVRTNLNGNECRRAYSISTIPGGSTIGVTIKKVDKGLMSGFLHDKASEGDFLDVMTPEGHFIIKPNHLSARDYYFYAAGSGITPIMSMLQTILEEEPKSTCYLLYGSRDETNIIFKGKLDKMIQKYEDQLHVDYVLSQPLSKKTGGIGGLFAKKSVDWQGYKGRIDEKMCENFIKEHPPKNDDVQYFICGPGDFIQKIESFLLKKHVDKKLIHKEYFTPLTSKDQKEIQSASSGLVSVTLKGENFTINVPKDKTILDVLVAAKKDPPYSCTSGACSTCMAKVTEGTVAMDSCYALDDDEIAGGFILTCQSHPTTANVSITYDI
ncbi:MAG: 2Fe-2S iron-sulfur cluster binding domain-containing protein [Saprospiraceae bacterium]|nr:2Fe-2S iron-sulfur cluster binding domain-containing protein [Saprospiraceae bacterium]